MEGAEGEMLAEHIYKLAVSIEAHLDELYCCGRVASKELAAMFERDLAHAYEIVSLSRSYRGNGVTVNAEQNMYLAPEERERLREIEKFVGSDLGKGYPMSERETERLVDESRWMMAKLRRLGIPAPAARVGTKGMPSVTAGD